MPASHALTILYLDIFQQFFQRLPNQTEPLSLLVFAQTSQINSSLPQNLTFAKPSPQYHFAHLLADDDQDFANDGRQFAIESATLDVILAIDIFHLLPDPKSFFAEVQRVLKPEGYLLLTGPGTSLLSYPFYKFLEKYRGGRQVRLDENPLLFVSEAETLAQNQGNMARLTLQFFRMEHQIALMEWVPQLKIIQKEWCHIFSYPLAKLLKNPNRLGKFVMKMSLNLDQLVAVFLARWLAGRLVIVMEKRNAPPQETASKTL